MEDDHPQNTGIEDISLARIQKQLRCDRDFASDVADLMDDLDITAGAAAHIVRCIDNVVDEHLILQKVEEHRRNSGSGPILQFPRAAPKSNPEGPAQ
jgi:hypothetical protein